MITGGGLHSNIDGSFEAIDLEYLIDENMYAPPCNNILPFPYKMWGAISTMAYVSMCIYMCFLVLLTSPD